MTLLLLLRGDGAAIRKLGRTDAFIKKNILLRSKCDHAHIGSLLVIDWILIDNPICAVCISALRNMVLQYPCHANGADTRHGAAARAEHRVHTGAIAFEHILRHPGLYGTREPAAVHAKRAAATEQMVAPA